MSQESNSENTPGRITTKANRKAHHKSRNGCRRCKERRVKCNEEKPLCFNCRRHGTPCIYPNQNPLPSAPSLGGRGTIGDRTLSSGLSANPARISSNTFELNDLALMHHWSVSTSISLSTAPWIRHLWQIVVPGLAIQHSYLLHGILALAALHIAYLQPVDCKNILVDASIHHTKAIGEFREAIVNLDEENPDAVFTAAIINMFHVISVTVRGSLPPNEDLSDASEVLDTEWVSIVRGCGAVLLPTYEAVSRGPFGGLLEIGDWNKLDPDENPSKDDERLLALQDKVWNPEKDWNHETYTKALYLLRQTMKWMDNNATSDSKVYWAGPFIWLHLIPENYLQLLKQRQPAALVLFAYYGALVHRLDNFWWAEGWGKRTVAVIDHCLGQYWRSQIEWPLLVVGLRTATP